MRAPQQKHHDHHIEQIPSRAVFAAETEQAGGTALPRFVKEAFEAYLDCGILAREFMRLRCAHCARDTLLTFSCPLKGTSLGAQAARHLALVRHAAHGRGGGVSGRLHTHLHALALDGVCSTAGSGGEADAPTFNEAAGPLFRAS